MVYEGDAYGYIKETPEVLRYIYQNKHKIFFESLQKIKGKQFSEIIVSGSGSSYNAAKAAATFAQNTLGIRVTPVYPIEVIEENSVIPEDALVIGISQQGTSMSVIQMLDCMRAKRRTTISVTGEHDVEIVSHSDANIYVECGYEDAGATTKGYSATVFTLFWFFISYQEQRGEISDREVKRYGIRLERVLNHLDTVIQKGTDWCEVKSQELKETKDLMIVSANSQKSLLLEGVLKFSESCRFPVRGYEADAFIHGMYNAVTKETEFLFLFSNDGKDVEDMKKLVIYYQKQGHKVYGIHGDKKLIDCAECDFVSDPDFSVLEDAILLQLLFVWTSKARGIDLNIPKDPDFHIYMGSKLEIEQEKGQNLCVDKG